MLPLLSTPSTVSKMPLRPSTSPISEEGSQPPGKGFCANHEGKHMQASKS
jgi:hypothetical protein